MSILLIRHGETAGNRDRVVQLPDIPLSEDGLAQAARLGARLARKPVRHVLASDMARARMTAEAVHRALGEAGREAPLELTELLHERNLGDIRGTPYSQIDFDLFGPDYDPPGGESWPVFHERVDLAWALVLERARALGLHGPDAHLAVVTHGLVCASIVGRLLALHPDLGIEAVPPVQGGGTFRNTALTVIEPLDDERWQVTRLACTAHLDGEVAAGASGQI